MGNSVKWLSLEPNHGLHGDSEFSYPFTLYHPRSELPLLTYRSLFATVLVGCPLRPRQGHDQLRHDKKIKLFCRSSGAAPA